MTPRYRQVGHRPVWQINQATKAWSFEIARNALVEHGLSQFEDGLKVGLDVAQTMLLSIPKHLRKKYLMEISYVLNRYGPRVRTRYRSRRKPGGK
jgi:hypothetical protein